MQSIRFRASSGQTLLSAAREAGIALASVCGGTGLCDSCRVRVLEGEVSAPSGAELNRLSASETADGWRLACQARAVGDVVAEAPPDSIGADQRLQVESTTRFVPASSPRTGFGLAVDVGTTKVAAYLVDLSSGHTVAADAVLNPQSAHGEDVISRIAFADSADGCATLHHLIVNCVADLAEKLCVRSGVSRSSVVEAVVVGNTVMHHLVAGLPVGGLGRAPYHPSFSGPLNLSAADVDLRLAADTRLYLPPNIAGYVGADHVAVLLALGASTRPTLVIDIGTNTEVSLLVDDRIFCCSCASGPAFEGGHISCGTRAMAGAIERVRVIAGEVHHQTIGGGKPIGVCGSGVLDAVSELVSHGAVDGHGNFRSGHHLLSDSNGRPAFVLAPAETTGHNRAISLTRQDISEVQLAKAAIRTGIEALFEAASVAVDELSDVVVAGAFGTYIDLASARRIGMLPDARNARFEQVGNAAGAGARRMLVDPDSRDAAERLALRAQHVDLTSNPRFTEMFAAALAF